MGKRQEHCGSVVGDFPRDKELRSIIGMHYDART